MSQIEAVVFDLDDTLYDEHSYTISGLTAVAIEFTKRLDPPFDLLDRMTELLNSEHSQRIFNVIAQEVGATNPDATVLEMIETFRGHRPSINLLPDATRSIGRLEGKRKLGLITDGYLIAQRQKIDALHLRTRFDAIIETDRWGREFWKPNQRAFVEIANMLQVPHHHCVYVADNLTKDFIAPNALGWMTICVQRTAGVYKDRTAPVGGEPQYTIESLDSLGPLID